jgi:hypothetical protein
MVGRGSKMETDTSAPAENFKGKKNVARQILHQAIVSIFNGDNPSAVHFMAQALEASLSDLFYQYRLGRGARRHRCLATATCPYRKLNLTSS